MNTHSDLDKKYSFYSYIKARQLCYQFAILILINKQTSVYSCSLPLYWQTFCIHDSGFTFIKEYGILMTCIMFMTLWNQKDKRVLYKNCGNYSYCVMGRGIFANHSVLILLSALAFIFSYLATYIKMKQTPIFQCFN